MGSNSGKHTKKSSKNKNIYSDRGSGRLYKRGKDGKEYPSGDRHSGSYYLEYRVNGKRVRQRLSHPVTGEPITDLSAAQKERIRITAPFTSKEKTEQIQALRAKLQVAENQHAEAVDQAIPPLRIADAWEAYTSSDDAPETGIDTLKHYASYWKKFRKWLKEEYPEIRYMREVQPATAKAYAFSLRAKKLSANTFNKYIGFLRLFFTILAAESRTEKNPFAGIKKRKLATNVRRELSIEELKTILEKAEGELQTLLLIGTFTGLRLGDCCTLKWGEVDLIRMQIKRIPNKLQHRPNAKPIVVGIPPALAGKLSATPAGKRKGYVVPEYAELYTFRNEKGRLAKQPDIAKRLRKHFRDTCGIQIHKEGTGFKKVSDPTGKHEYIWEYTGKRAVVEVGFHSLRHTFVSLQAEAGTPMAVVQAIVGHGNPAMTSHYTHIGEQAARQAALALPENIVDAEYEEIPDPLPKWAAEKLKTMNDDNWREIQKEMLHGNDR